MSKAVILPILTTIALAIQLIFDVEIPESVINDASLAVANVIAVGVTISGVFKTYNKKDKTEKDKKTDLDA